MIDIDMYQWLKKRFSSIHDIDTQPYTHAQHTGIDNIVRRSDSQPN